MLIGILTDNPGPSFTKNVDKKFVSTVKDLLRDGTDPSVQQILRETLDRLEVDKAYDRNLEPIFAMWRKEKGIGASFAGGRPIPRTMNAPPFDPNGPPSAQALSGSGSHYARQYSNQGGLPPPVELAGRVEEAKTSAKLLQQLIQSTPADEVLSNELIKEFADRCQSAQRSIQGYINCDNPAPDHDTLQTLIETNEQLSLATSKHQRAVLNARRAVGGGSSSTGPRGTGPYPPPSQPPNGVTSASNLSSSARRTPQQAPLVDTEDDPTDVSYAAPVRRPTYPSPGALNNHPVELPAPATYSSDAGLNPFSDAHTAPHPLEPMNYGSSVITPPAPAPLRGDKVAGGGYTNGEGTTAADGRAVRMRGGAAPSEEEADDERDGVSRTGMTGTKSGTRTDGGSVSSGIVSPLETRPMAFRY